MFSDHSWSIESLSRYLLGDVIADPTINNNIFLSVMFLICFDIPETPLLQNFTKTYNDDGSVTLKWKLLNEDIIEYITYIVQHGNEKFTVSSFQTDFHISAGFEIIKLVVQVRKNISINYMLINCLVFIRILKNMNQNI